MAEIIPFTVATRAALGPTRPCLLPVEHQGCVPEGVFDIRTALLQLQLLRHVTSRNRGMCAELGWPSWL